MNNSPGSASKWFDSLFHLAKHALLTKLSVSLFLLSCGDILSNPGPTNVVSNTSINNSNGSSFIYSKPRKRGIVIAHLNVRGLRSSMDELKVFMSNQSMDVLTVSETWLNSTIIDSEVELPGYYLLRKDRESGNGNQQINC
jgi:hypothetical protein